MANQQIVDYINQYRSKYSINDLKNYLVSQGYSQKDVDEAAAAAMSNIPPPNIAPQLQPQFSSVNPNYSASRDYSKAAIAYILMWITGLIIYFTAEKEDRFTRFHAMQAIFLGIVFTIIYFVIGIIFTPFAFFIFGFGYMVMSLLWIVAIIIVIMMAVSAYKGNMVKLPIIGSIAENIISKN